MIEFVYGILASFGYRHPIHPPSVHVPMGMILGGFVFQALSLRWERFKESAYYCLVLALIASPVAAVLGLMDWQHRLLGHMTPFVIAKMVLSALFMTVLGITVYLKHNNRMTSKAMLIAYAACAVLAVGLGFVGGELAYG